MNSSLTSRLTEQITAAVESRLGGGSNPSMRSLIAQEVEAALRSPGAAEALDSMPAADDAPTERVVITANGRNRGGIVARLAALIDEFEGDIRDISQTIVGDYFTMIVVIDIASARRKGSRFGQLRERLQQEGQALGIHVVAMHDDILSTMHSV
jgi:ACT domain-containing protein